jgi:oligogalacturonide lyase
MSHHDYREEPNVRFSPDKTMVLFTSHLFGASYLGSHADSYAPAF